jgi:nitrite reductase (NADH) small subunit
MDDWVEVARVDECPPGTGLERVVQDRVVALFNVEGSFFALDGVCPHQGGPLGKGSLEGQIITCPWHGWQFNATTGCHELNQRIRQPKYAVRVADDRVLVNFSEGASSS